MSKWLLLGLLVIVLLLLLLIYWLLSTDSGFRYAVNFSRDYWPETLTIDKVDGNLADGIALNGLSFKDESTSLTIKSAELDVSLSSLLNRQLIIKTLAVNDIAVILTPVENNEPSQPFSGIEAPLDIFINDASVNRATIIASGQTIELESFNTKASWLGHTANIETLTLNTGAIGPSAKVATSDGSSDAPAPVIKKASVQLSGEISTTEKLPMALTYRYDINPEPLLENTVGKGSINGNIKKLTIDNQSTLLSASINNLQPEPSTFNTKAIIDLEQSTLDATLLIDGKNTLLMGQQWLSVSDLNAELKGPFQALNIDITGGIDSLLLKGASGKKTIPKTRIALSSLLDNEKFDLKALTLDTETGKINTQGEFLLESKRLQQKITLSQLNPGFWDDYLEGNISGTLLVDVVVGDALVINKINTDLTGSMAKQAFKSTLDISGNQTLLTINQANIAQGPNQLSAKGQLALVVDQLSQTGGDLVVTVKAPQLNKLHPSIAGNLNMDATIKRAGKNVQVQTTLNSEKLRFNDNTIGTLSVSGNGSADPASWQTSAKGQLNLVAKQLQLAGQVIDQTQIAFGGSTRQHQLTLEVDGQSFATDLSLTGKLTDKQWLATLDQHHLSGEFQTDDIQQKIQWQLAKPTQFILGLKANTLSLNDACWQEVGTEASLCIDLTTPKPDNLQADVRLNKLPTASLAPWLPAKLSTEGYLSGQAKWQSANSALSATLDWLDGNIRVDEASPAYSVNVDKAKLAIDLKQSTLKSRLDVQLSDQTTIKGDFDVANIDAANIDLATINTGDIAIAIPNTDYIASLSPEISRITGEVALNISASGKLKTPIIEGSGTLGDDGELVLTRTNTLVSKPEFTIVPNGNLLMLKGQTFVSAAVGEAPDKGQAKTKKTPPAKNKAAPKAPIKDAGLLTFDGSIDLEKSRYEIRVKGQQLELINTDELQITANADINAIIDNGAMTLTGDLAVPQARIVVTNLPPSAVTPSNDIVIINEPEVVEQESNNDITMDMKVTLGDQVFFSALGLESNLKGSLKLKQTPRRSLFAQGQIDLVDGKYEFYGQKLTIEEGKLYFNGPIDNPRIVVRAVRTTKTVTAGVRVEGTPDSLESSLFSEPTLPEAEVLSYIITGKPLSGGGGGSEDELAQAAILLGLKQTTGLIGANEISIDSSDGTGNSALTTGKQINDKLYLGYRYGIFSRNGAWLLKYALTESLQLESAYGENQTIDLIYEIKRP